MSAPIPVYWLEPTGEFLKTEFPDGGSRTEHYFRDSRSGILVLLSNAEPGAVWNASWIAELLKGDRMDSFGCLPADGQYLACKLPNGSSWSIDSRASNCTRPTEPHHCWCRHGHAKDGTLHVDKRPEPGDSTCAAGAGSILSGNWHGFLHGGKLIEA